jgi:hypothetical protein
MNGWYWRGFGLLFGLSAIFIWFAYYERGKEDEKILIDNDPSIEACNDFREGKISFLKVFQLTNKDEGPIGDWIIPGENKIGENILSQYPKRNRLEISFNFRLNDDQESIARRAYEFARLYNLGMFNQIQIAKRQGIE